MRHHSDNLIRRMTVLATVLIALVVDRSPDARAELSYEWVNITMTAAFAPRDGAGALSYRGRMWFLGGWNPAKSQRRFFPRICNNEVWNSSDGRD